MGTVAVASRSFSKNEVLRNKLISKYPDTKFNDEGLSLHGDELISFLKGHQKAITALEKIDEKILAELPDLEVIGKYGVGLDMLDLRAMKKFGVKLGWKGGVNKRSVSEQVIAAAISLLHRSYYSNDQVKRGDWRQIKGKQLTGKRIGIIGCGHIGKDLINLLQPFNCKIFANDIIDFHDFYQKYNITPLDIEDLLSKSEIVTLHLPMNHSTYRILNEQMLDLMRKDSILINFARGGLIDEQALKKKISNGEISGVALDVFECEPPGENSLIDMENVFVTPHIGGSTTEAIEAMGISAIEGLDSAEDPTNFLAYS